MEKYCSMNWQQVVAAQAVDRNGDGPIKLLKKLEGTSCIMQE